MIIKKKEKEKKHAFFYIAHNYTVRDPAGWSFLGKTLPTFFLSVVLYVFLSCRNKLTSGWIEQGNQMNGSLSPFIIINDFEQRNIATLPFSRSCRWPTFRDLLYSHWHPGNVM